MVHYLTIIFLFLSSFAYAAYSPMNVKEADGTPNVQDVRRVVVTNGKLTDDGSGQITIDLSGGVGDITDVYDCASGDCNNISMSSGDILDAGLGNLEIPNSNTLPAACNVGQLYADDDATSGSRIYLCESANTWVLQSGSASPGGSNTQVQFNDSGAFGGDSGFTFIKATDAVAINGDLTVDTSTLKVDSTNNRVGIGTTAPEQELDVRGNGLFLDSNDVALGLPLTTSSVLSVSEKDGRVSLAGIVENSGEFSSSTTKTVAGVSIDTDFASSTNQGTNTIFKASFRPAFSNISGFLNGLTSLSSNTSESSETLDTDFSQSTTSGDDLIVAALGKGKVDLFGDISGSTSSSVISAEVTPNIDYSSDFAISSTNKLHQLYKISNMYDNLTSFSVGGKGTSSSGSIIYDNTTTGVNGTMDFAHSVTGGNFSYISDNAQTLQAFYVSNGITSSFSTDHDNGVTNSSFDYALNGSGTFGLFMDNTSAMVSGFFNGYTAISGLGTTLGLDFATSGNSNFFQAYIKDAIYEVGGGDRNFTMGSAINGKNTLISGDDNFALGQGLNITADNAFVFGKNVTNNTSNSLAIGFNSTQSTTTTLFVDGTNSKVGVGDSAPAGKLDVTVAGADNVTGVVIDQGDTDQIALDINASNTTANVLDIVGNALTSGVGINVESASTGLTGDLIKAELTAANTGNTGNLLKIGITGTAGTATTINVTNAGTGLSFRVNDDGTYADSTPFVIDASGNVGIGTTNPSTSLEVSGGIKATQIDTGDGAVTLKSSTYTPTRSAETNLDSNVTMTEAQYLRVGNTVTVSGRFTADPTTTLTSTSFEITLPIASNLGAEEDAAGVAFCGAIAGQGAEIKGSVANNTAVIIWNAVDVTSQSWSYTFTYQVI